MTNQPITASFDDFEVLAERFYEQACDWSTAYNMPIGAVLAGVIFHLCTEAQLGAVPEELLLATVSAAAERYRMYEHDATISEARS